MGAHTTSDDPTKYRVSAEVEVWKHRDPIERLKSYLVHAKMADQPSSTRSRRRPTSWRDGPGGLPEHANPAPESMFDHIYVEETPLVAAERRDFVEYHAGFEGGH